MVANLLESTQPQGAAYSLLTTTGSTLDITLQPPGGAGAVASVFGRVGAVVATLADYAASLISNDSGVVGATVKDALNTVAAAAVAAAAAATAAQQPFRATFYVNSTFAGTQTGSASNPFTTIAAAFAAGTAIAAASMIVYLPPNAAHVENVVFPTTGTVELATQTQWGYINATLTGTIDLSTTATARRALTNLSVTGNVTGAAVGGASRLLVTACQLGGTLNLTSGGGTWRCGLKGTVSDGGAVGFGGFVTGAASVAGVFYTSNWTFVSTCTFSGAGGGSVVFSDTLFSIGGGAAITSNGAGAVNATMVDCVFSGPVAITAASGTLTLNVDGATATALAAASTTAGAGVTIKTLNSNASDRRTVANNLGSTALTGVYPDSLMVAEGCFTLKAGGTLGIASLNVIYTDENGTLQTKPVCTIDITGAVSAEGHGSVQFQQNGASAPAFSITGIVTPGALSLASAIAVRQAS